MAGSCVPEWFLTWNEERQTVCFLGLCVWRHSGPGLSKTLPFEFQQTKKEQLLIVRCWKNASKANSSSPARCRMGLKWFCVSGGYAHLQGFRAVSKQSLYIPSSCSHQITCVVGLHGEVRIVVIIYLQSEEKRSEVKAEPSHHPQYNSKTLVNIRKKK